MEPSPPEIINSKPASRGPRTIARVLLAVLLVYLLLAYFILPLIWRVAEDRHPALAAAPDITHTANGIPGDPLNVALVGTEEDIHKAMIAARWYPADPITLKSAMRICVGVVFDRPYDDAPVSPLYLWGRKEDLAFEQPIGDNPRSRHHVRFWKSSELDKDGKPLWMGSATLDLRVGFSKDTAQITHHISAEVDPERDKVIADLKATGDLSSVHWIDNFHKVLSGKNGGGDPWHTDGRLAVGVLKLADVHAQVETALQRNP